MSGFSHTVANADQLQFLIQHLANMPMPFNAEIVTKGKKRSKSQNEMIYAIYRDIAAQKQDESQLDIRCECKLLYGVKILRRDDSQFRAFYDRAIKGLDHGEKLLAMKFVPVTSMMDTKQCGEYLDEVIKEYSKAGIFLADPRQTP